MYVLEYEIQPRSDTIPVSAWFSFFSPDLTLLEKSRSLPRQPVFSCLPSPSHGTPSCLLTSVSVWESPLIDLHTWNQPITYMFIEVDCNCSLKSTTICSIYQEFHMYQTVTFVSFRFKFLCWETFYFRVYQHILSRSQQFYSTSLFVSYAFMLHEQTP